MLHTIVVSGQFLPFSGRHAVAEARTRAIEVFGDKAVLGLGGEGDYDSFCVALGKSTWSKRCDDFCAYLSEQHLRFTAVAYSGEESRVLQDDVSAATIKAADAVRLEATPRERPSSLAG